ncbi:MAG: hypothetical protein AAB488_00575 [Patescibacteria group bacterium]
MRKILTSFGVGALSLLFAGVALAQVDTSATTSKDKKSAVKNVSSKIVDKKIEKEDTRPLLKEKKKNISKRTLAIVTEINKKIIQIEKHITRVGVMIAKFESKGANTTDAKTHLELAKTKLGELKTRAEEIKNTANEIATSQTPRDAAKTFKDKVKELQTLIKEVRTHLVESIVALKNGVMNRTATSTQTQ